MKFLILAFVTVSHGLRVTDQSQFDTGPSNQASGATGSEAMTFGHVSVFKDSPWVYISSSDGWIRPVTKGLYEEPDSPQGLSLVMRIHRRTGVELVKNVSDCISDHADPDQVARVMMFSDRLKGDLSDTSLAVGKRPTIHFSRQPKEWVISWYRSNKFMSNDRYEEQSWMTAPGTMFKSHGDDLSLTEWMKTRGVVIDPEESIMTFLRRVPVEVGLAVSYRELTTDVLPQAMKFGTECRKNPMCKQVCLEAFNGVSHDQYMRKWAEIFNFVGIDLEKEENEGLKTCVAAQKKWISDISEQDMEKLGPMITQIDQTLKQWEGGPVLDKSFCKDSFLYGS